ncbi:hypothetical protein [Methylophaga sp. OBS3]|uniref:hypothetical protein n=1 Tax=Methylophaga sp. OBS3 TaxID=2991934 RepID=UPI0022566C3E|nr:hypothetical protein [Methylophaga sp. OBS3]MCX4189167.1 hypothetical protein [Methylophaga sp. OBS3]
MFAKKYLILMMIIITFPTFAYDPMGLGESSQVSIRDPFTPSALMYEQAGTLSNIGSDAFGFMPGDVPDTKVPTMRLKGLIKEKDTGEQIALLEVTGRGVYMVREGDEINIDPSKPASAIRISDITRLSVTIETGTLGRIRVLR